jgi:hypothetical protein
VAVLQGELGKFAELAEARSKCVLGKTRGCLRGGKEQQGSAVRERRKRWIAHVLSSVNTNTAKQKIVFFCAVFLCCGAGGI